MYLERFRNLDYLEHELEQYNRAEQEKMDEADRALKRMQKRLREQELKMLRGAQVSAAVQQQCSNAYVATMICTMRFACS